MKKLLAYITISLYLIGSTEAYQLLKIGYLIEHYIEHKNVNNLGLIEFIDVHYLQPTVVDADYAEDMKLPFKSHEDCQVQITHLAKLQTIEYTNDIPFIETSKGSSKYKSPLLGSQFLDEVFQPPKV